MAQATIATTVTGLQGHPVATTAPSIVGQLLTWNGSAWAPDNTTYMPVAGGTFTGPVTLAGAATTANQPATLNQVATAAGVNIGRNYLLNPQFSINQRASAAYAGSAGAGLSYTFDRWAQNLGAAGDSNTVTVVGASDADRAAIGDECVWNYPSCAVTGGTGASNYVVFQQDIEDCRRLSNKTTTVSFWAYSPTSLRLGISWQQNFGNVGSPSATEFGNIGVAALTTGWARYSYTFTWPSAAGKTFGSSGNFANSFSAITFWLSCPPANTANYGYSGNLGAQTGTINIWGVQIEIGTQATPFEHRDPEIELALCQRYYSVLSPFLFGGYVPGADNLIWGTTALLVQMRAVPTVTFTDTNFSNAGNLSLNNSSPSLVSLQASSTASGTVWAACQINLSADL